MIGALWAVMVMSLAATSIVTTSLTGARLMRGRIRSAELSAAADAVVNIVLLRLLSLDRATSVPVDGTSFHVIFESHVALASVQDEEGKIDLNFAGRDLLVRLITSRGIGSAAADALASRILEWRDASLGKRDLEGSVEEYRKTGMPYGPRSGFFETVEELRLVMGGTSGFADPLAPLLTVFSQKASPSVDTAFLLGLPKPPETTKRDTSAALMSPAGTNSRRSQKSRTPVGSVLSINVLIRNDIEEASKTTVIRCTGIVSDPFWTYQ